MTTSGPPPANLDVVRRLGGVAVWLQLAMTLAIIVVTSMFGPRPATAEEYFELLRQDRLVALVRADYASPIIIALYLFAFPGVYAALPAKRLPLAGLATALVFVGVAICLATHSGLSMVHLGDAYAATSEAAERARLIAAGEAVLAAGMWNSTAGFAAGVLLQGAGLMMSVLMLDSEAFWRWTAYSGILANGADLAQHLIRPALPSFADVLLIAAGPFYLLWFFFLGRNLLFSASDRAQKRTRLER